MREHGKVLVVLAALLLSGCGQNTNPQPKDVPLTDVVSLRDLPGPDGCIPGTETPPEFKYGKWWPGECENAAIYH